MQKKSTRLLKNFLTDTGSESSLDTSSESSLNTSSESSLDTSSGSSFDLSNTSTEFDSEDTIELDSDSEDTIELDSDKSNLSRTISIISSSDSSSESQIDSIFPQSQDSFISCFSDTLYDLNDQNSLSRLDYITPPPSPEQPRAPSFIYSPKSGPVLRESVRMNQNKK